MKKKNTKRYVIKKLKAKPISFAEFARYVVDHYPKSTKKAIGESYSRQFFDFILENDDYCNTTNFAYRLLIKADLEISKLKAERLAMEKGSHKNISRLIKKMRAQDKQAQKTITRQQRELKSCHSIMRTLRKKVSAQARNLTTKDKRIRKLKDGEDPVNFYQNNDSV